MKRLLYISICLAMFAGLFVGCVFDLFSGSGNYDGRILTVQTVSLFDQRTASRLERASWKGDWVFRRDRLNLIDKELKLSKPDLLLMQELIEKSGSPSESDQSILSAGSLSGHKWKTVVVKEFDDTYELQKMGIAVGYSLRILPEDKEVRNFWLLGNDGYLQVVNTESNGEPLVVFNVHMPSVTDNRFLWYAFVKKRIVERLESVGTCRKRVVVAGYLPGDTGARRFKEFVDSLEMVDASIGFCQIASKCYTSTPINDIFMATVGDAAPSRTDRIFVHKSAVVYTSNRTFVQPDTNNRYAKKFGIPKVWPTQRFGWGISARFSQCSESEILEPKAVEVGSID